MAPRTANQPTISVRGAREHNLKNISVELPRDKLIVFTGLSGSGKSSLAFDTIYAEGQRRYVESLSSYARQFLGQMDKPDVDVIEGLSPAISIDQKSASRNPRSTVGTITEIYDYLRLLYARIGVQHCPEHGNVLGRQTPQQIVDRVLLLPEGTRFQVLAPVVRGRKGEYETLLEDLSAQGFVRARVDGEIVDLDEFLKRPEKLARYEQHTIEVVVDRLVMREGIDRRLTDSLETALKLADGVAELEIVHREGEASVDGDVLTFSEHLVCPVDGRSLRGAGAAQLLVQLAVRRLPDVRRPRHHVRDRPRARHPRRRALAQRRRHRPVAQRPHPVLHPHARLRRRRRQDRHGRAVGLADGQAAEGDPRGHQGQHHGQVQEPLRPPAPVHDDVRGHHPVDQAAPRGRRERLGARAVRGLHARGPVQGVRGRPPEAGDAGRHDQRPQHLRGLRPLDRRVGQVPRRPRADRAGADDRRAGDQGGQRPARLPARRRPRLPHAVALGRHAGRR